MGGTPQTYRGVGGGAAGVNKRVGWVLLVFLACNVAMSSYLFTQLPATEVSGCTLSAEDMDSERMERIASTEFLLLCVIAVVNVGILIGLWAGTRRQT